MLPLPGFPSRQCLLLAYRLLPGLVCLFLALPASASSPRNLILMIGDGMGFAHLEAAGYHTAQGYNPPFACFDVEAALSTYALDGSYDPQRAATDSRYLLAGPTDSAAAATALACGHKTWRKVIGMAPDTQGRLARVENLLEAAEARGKMTGVVTSVPISHATPAAFVAHDSHRKHYKAIARQMLKHSAVDLIAGAGHPAFDDDGRPRRQFPDYHYLGGEKLWQELKAGRAGGDADGDGQPDPWTLVDDRERIRGLANGPTPKRLLMLAPAGSTLQQKRSGDVNAAAGDVSLTAGEPTLAELTAAALNALDDDPDGLVLMVEGGAIDWASHAGQRGRMIEELDDFAAAVAVVETWVAAHGGWEANLLVITADHETGGLKESGFTTGHHSNDLVPLLARGAGAGELEALATHRDPRHGRYLDNAELGRWLMRKAAEGEGLKAKMEN